MKMLSIVAGAALVLGVSVAGPAPAEARTYVSFGINAGPGYGYYGGPRYGGYYGGYYGPRYRGYYDGYYGPRYRGWDRGYRGYDRRWDRRWDRPRYRYYDRPRRWRERW